MDPISHQSILTDRNLLKHPEVFGSLDRGCSLTKLLYVKSLPDQPEKASLEMAVFGNLDFDQALEWLVARAIEEGAFKAEGRKFHVTGVGGDKYRSIIQEKLGIEVEFVDEFMCQQTGGHFFVSNFVDEQFCYPEGLEPLKEEVDMPDWIEAVMKRTDEIFAETDGQRFPVIFGFCGSASGFTRLNEDGSTQVLGVTWFGGKSFLGLSQLLLGTNNYDEIMELAAKGDRRRVDTQAKEVIAQDDTAEYKMIAADTPMFPFGKASEGKVGSVNREDLAAAVVGSTVNSLLPLISSYSMSMRVRRVYLGGHFFRAKVARDMLLELVASTSPISRHLRILFLSNGNTGCVGALQTSSADALAWRSKLRLN